MRMEDLVRHPWMLGPTISHAALHAELQRRKETVDENKMREKAEKASKVSGDAAGGAVPAQAGLLERGDVSMTRGEGPVHVIDYASESLPQAVPSITAFAKNAGGGLAAPRVGDGNSNESSGALSSLPRGATMSADAFGDASSGGEAYEGGEDGGEWATESKAVPAASASSSAAAASSSAAAPSAPLFQATTQSFTRFSTGRYPGQPGELLKYLQSTLGGQLGCTLVTNERKYKIKRAKCVTSQGIIEFSVAIFQDPASTEHIVEFKRLSSDSAQYRVLYAEMRFAMKSIISEQPSETLRTAGETTQAQ
jgi:hypothetical protein